MASLGTTPDTQNALFLKTFHLILQAAKRVSCRIDAENFAGDLLAKLLPRWQWLVAGRAVIEAGRLPRWLVAEVRSEAWALHKREEKARRLTENYVCGRSARNCPSPVAVLVAQEFQERLPARLRAVLQMLQEGWSQRAIADQLGISERTVFNRRQELIRRAERDLAYQSPYRAAAGDLAAESRISCGPKWATPSNKTRIAT